MAETKKKNTTTTTATAITIIISIINNNNSVALFKSPFPRKNNAEVAFESRRALKKDNNKLLQMLQMRYWIFSVGFACVRYLEGICSATKN